MQSEKATDLCEVICIRKHDNNLYHFYVVKYIFQFPS